MGGRGSRGGGIAPGDTKLKKGEAVDLTKKTGGVTAGGGTGGGGGGGGGAGGSSGGGAGTGGIQNGGGNGSGGGGGGADTTTTTTTTTETNIDFDNLTDAELKTLFEDSEIFDELIEKYPDDDKFKKNYNRYYSRWLTSQGAKPPATYDPVEANITADVVPDVAREIEYQVKQLPERLRHVLKERGLRVNVSRRADGHPQWAAYSATTGRVSTDLTADGREVGTLSFYNGYTNDVFISTDHPGGSYNVMVHEMAHALDAKWLKDPVKVRTDAGNEITVSNISRDDPEFVKMHDDYLLPVKDVDEWFNYFIGGPSGTNDEAGRAELFAEGLAAYFDGGKVRLREFLFKGIKDQTARYHVADTLISIWTRYGIIE